MLTTILSAALLVSACVFGETISANARYDIPTETPAESAPAEATLTEGEVRKINKATGKLTLKHGPIANLDMPSMTMTFRVANPAMLDELKEGDKVKFYAEKLKGAMTVTTLELVN